MNIKSWTEKKKFVFFFNFDNQNWQGPSSEKKWPRSTLWGGHIASGSGWAPPPPLRWHQTCHLRRVDIVWSKKRWNHSYQTDTRLVIQGSFRRCSYSKCSPILGVLASFMGHFLGHFLCCMEIVCRLYHCWREK